MSGPVGMAYHQLVAAGELKPDPAQERSVAALDRLAAELSASHGAFLRKLFNKPQSGMAGAYLWGGVGRGKSMLMDLAFEHIPIRQKRRVHFHAFMLETHFESARDDRLAHLFDIAVESDYSYWFVCRPRALGTRPVRLFHDWLVETVASA